MALKVKDIMQRLAQLDPESYVARLDGTHDHWGQMFDLVETVTLENNVPVDGYRKPCWNNVVVLR